MKPAPKDRYGSAVGIVSGIVDELVVEGKRRPCVEAVGVVRFEDFFSPVVEFRGGHAKKRKGAQCEFWSWLHRPLHHVATNADAPLPTSELVSDR